MAFITTLLTTVLPLLLQLVMWILNKTQQDQAVKTAFLQFIAQAQANNISVQLHDDYLDELNRIKADLAASKVAPIGPSES